jgi:hypothetical protein
MLGACANATPAAITTTHVPTANRPNPFIALVLVSVAQPNLYAQSTKRRMENLHAALVLTYALCHS